MVRIRWRFMMQRAHGVGKRTGVMLRRWPLWYSSLDADSCKPRVVSDMTVCKGFFPHCVSKCAQKRPILTLIRSFFTGPWILRKVLFNLTRRLWLLWNVLLYNTLWAYFMPPAVYLSTITAGTVLRPVSAFSNLFKKLYIVVLWTVWGAICLKRMQILQTACFPTYIHISNYTRHRVCCYGFSNV